MSSMLEIFSRFALPLPSVGSVVPPTWSAASGLTLLMNVSSNGCKLMRFDSTFGEWISVWQVELPDVPRKQIPTILPALLEEELNQISMNCISPR